MAISQWQTQVQSFDERRDLIIPGNAEETIEFAANQFIEIGQGAIKKQGFFTVAFSGGQTPLAIYKKLSQLPLKEQLDWSKLRCFWSDERSVSPSDPENNYFASMKAGLDHLPIPPEKIFRMEAESDIEENAKRYEHLIRQWVPSCSFDLLMLGVGEDGHTASLFPRTHGLHTHNRLVTANYIPEKKIWRMSLTYDCIHLAKTTCIYAIGKNKAETVAKVFSSPYNPDHFPVQKVGLPAHKALWILDQDSAKDLVL